MEFTIKPERCPLHMKRRCKMMAQGALWAEGKTVMASDSDFSLEADVPAGYIAPLLGSSAANWE